MLVCSYLVIVKKWVVMDISSTTTLNNVLSCSYFVYQPICMSPFVHKIEHITNINAYATCEFFIKEYVS